jgi:hypothetical protein
MVLIRSLMGRRVLAVLAVLFAWAVQLFEWYSLMLFGFMIGWSYDEWGRLRPGVIEANQGRYETQLLFWLLALCFRRWYVKEVRLFVVEVFPSVGVESSAWENSVVWVKGLYRRYFSATN